MLRTQELSISDEVNVFFNDPADRLDLNHGLREMLKRLWRELLVQVPVSAWTTAKSGCSTAPECNTTRLVTPTTAGSATVRKLTSKKCGPWPRS